MLNLKEKEITQLKDEITFLKSELMSKDKSVEYMKWKLDEFEVDLVRVKTEKGNV